MGSSEILPMGETRFVVKHFDSCDLVAPKKCGSTSVYYMRPDVPTEEIEADKYIPNKPVVLIVRNPQLRLLSSARRFTDYDAQVAHAAPYLHHFSELPLRYILFEKLGSYLPERHGKELGNQYPAVPEDFPVQPGDLTDEMKYYQKIISLNEELPIQDITKWES